jgi:TusE/DsrC/DsvC family sulfur relay protein
MGLEVNGKQLSVDNEGFLLDPADWDETVALKIAEQLNIEMQEERWMVVRFVREYYEINQRVPEARMALKAMREQLGHERATRKYLYSLFPYGYGQQACKIAGMRKPLKLMLDL